MKQCEFCGATLPAEASFCGKCGHVPSQIAHQGTQVGDLPTQQLESADESNSTILTPSGKLAFSGASTGPLRPLTLVPFDEDKEEKNEEEDEEEKRRRAAMLGLALPLMGGLADQHPIGQVPGIQGTPQMAHIPGISGTPAMQGGMPFSPGTPAPAVQSGPPVQLPGSPPPHPAPPLPHPPPGHPGGSPGSSTGGPSGCLTIGAIIAAAALIILATIIGLGLTVLAPNLTLSGSPNVTPGSAMTLHGSNFLPNSSVTLTLDGGTPLYVLRQPAAPRAALGNAQHAANTGLALHPSLSPAATNVVPVQGDGTFSVTFQVNPSWLIGPHTVHATESVSHRSASLSFTIVQSGTSATPTPTPTDTPTPTPTATPTPTPTPTTPPTPAPTLSCVTPGKLALGPVSEFSSQTDGGSVTLCTSGSGTLTWQASWDQKQAPWLHMAQKSGSVQAPNQFQASISASAANLAAGTYTATITFIGIESNTTQALTVTFTVQASCLRVGPTGLSFTATAGSDPKPNTQSISMTNCGLTSNWSAQIKDDGNHWLSISPSNGTLKGNTSGTITVTVTSANLPVGGYTDSVTIKLGSKTATVVVDLTVQQIPGITAAPNPVNSNCTTDQSGNAVCTVVLTNTSSGIPLSWSATADQSGVTIKPGSDTIPAGGTETVTIIFSLCITTIITFSGPANSASVTWNCTPIG